MVNIQLLTGNKTSLIRFIDFEDHYIASYSSEGLQAKIFLLLILSKYNMTLYFTSLTFFFSFYQNNYILVNASQKIDQWWLKKTHLTLRNMLYGCPGVLGGHRRCTTLYAMLSQRPWLKSGRGLLLHITSPLSPLISHQLTII